MPFLLNRNDQTNGTTHLTYDIGPTERANVVVPLISAHLTELTPPDDLLGYTLATVRRPIARQKDNP